MSYDFADYALMFFSSFVVVFLLGLQSKNVMHSRYVAAVITSIGISISQFIFVKYASGGSYDVLVVCAIGGCMGIALSIWIYDNFLRMRRAY